MLRSTLAHTLAARRLWLVLYIVSLLSGLIVIALPATQLLDATTYISIVDAADGVDLYQLSELFQIGEINTALDSALFDGLTERVTLTVFGVVGLALGLAFIVSAFVRGGVLGVLNQHVASAERGRGQFTSHAQRYYFSMLMLQMLHGFLIVTLVALVLALVSMVTTLELASQSGVWTIVALGGFVWLLYQIWFEMAAATIIAHRVRNPFVAFWRGMRQFFDQPLRVLGFFLLALLLMAGIQVLFRFGIHPNLPPRLWPLVLVVQQVSILLRLVLRVFRYAGLLSFVQLRGEQARPEPSRRYARATT